MRCVYLIQSITHPSKRYVGCTDAVRRRLAEHNAEKSSHTARYRPWKLVVTVCFESDAGAERFKRYLKHGSGHAFARRHFWQGFLSAR